MRLTAQLRGPLDALTDHLWYEWVAIACFLGSIGPSDVGLQVYW